MEGKVYEESRQRVKYYKGEPEEDSLQRYLLNQDLKEVAALASHVAT